MSVESLLAATTATVLSQWIAILVGLVMLAEAVFAWEWSVRSGPLRWSIRLFGRLGGRVAYGLLGIAMTAWGCVRVSELLVS